MNRTLVVCAYLLLPLAQTFGQYESWPQRATLVLLTTPDGADLPPSAREENFPVLVRLRRETFPFEQTQAAGADVRFAADGKPLAYQIESWDAAAGEAAVWVRIPEIRGQARREFTMHWGRADAASESNGPAVFNQDYGHAVVMHLGDAGDVLRDEARTVTGSNAGTTPCDGRIGRARRFEPGRGIACGIDIDHLPHGSGPCTTEAWLRPDQVNGIAIGWGNEQGQGKVTMRVNSPPHLRMECYFSGADVAGGTRLKMSEWVHVVHAYREGDSRLYVNGRLDGVTTGRQSPLNVRTPARMWLGGWYNNYLYAGAIDEVRIARVARSADWVKLSYENQKPHQTLVGTPIRSGTRFGVATRELIVDEGRRATVKAQADGADKVAWILSRGGVDAVVATDTFAYTFDVGRVLRDESCVLRFKAVYPNEVRTDDVAVTIREAIPEPRYELAAPTAWNGRDTIEVVPQIENRDALVAAGAAALRTRWEVIGGAVLQEALPDRLILKRSQYTGPIRVVCAIDNGGAPIERSAAIEVNEPSSDPWIARAPEADERPEEGQFFARDDSNHGTLFYRGKLAERAEAVFLKVYADDRPYASETQTPAADGRYAFAVKLKPGLIKYRIEFGTRIAGTEKVLHAVGNLVCGDAYLIDGQSNALATDTREESPRLTSDWIRSYAGPTGRGDGNEWVRQNLKEAEQAGPTRPNGWCSPVWKAARSEQQTEIGWWGMELAQRLVREHEVPIFILNAAVGGSRIDEHQPSPTDRTDLQTMYGRMLWRIRQARLTHGIRAVIWHQGENDQGAAGPSGGYGWESYPRYFTQLAAAWKEDLPNVRQYYLFQIWPNACAMGGRDGSGDRLREVQRTLPRLFSNLHILSTLGIQPPGSCHYPLAGWSEFARLLQPLIDRDFYSKTSEVSITPPNLRHARFADDSRKTVVLEFDQAVAWDESLADQFYFDDRRGEVAEGRASGRELVLTLHQPSTAVRITYLKERDWDPARLLRGTNGIAALTFCDVTLTPAPPR